MRKPPDSNERRPPDRPLTELERARRRRDQAAQGSPDWDAASEAVLELESDDPVSFAETRGRKLYLVRPYSAV